MRRPKAEESANPNDYLPCKYCHGFFLGCELWRHASKCPLRCEEDNHSSRSMQYEGKLLIAGGKFPDGSSKLLSDKVLATMAHDSISLAVKSDKTILTLGSEMLEKKGADKPNEISQKMRLMGRILVEAGKNCGNQNASLKDLLIPSNFDMLMKCSRDIGGYEENDGTSSKRSYHHPQQLTADTKYGRRKYY